MHRFFANPGWLWLLLLVAAAGVLAWRAAKLKHKYLVLLGPLEISNRGSGMGSPALTLTGLSLLAIGAAGPRWGFGPPPPTAPGRDVVLVIDVSRSMLATDALPNRLARARQAFNQLLDLLERPGGHRLALIAFAAQPLVICPLTYDLDHVRAKLVELDPESPRLGLLAGPGAVSGTRIGAAVMAAIDVAGPLFREATEIVLASDGDDPAPGDEWRRGLLAARQAGIRVSTLGVGDPDRDSEVITSGGTVSFRGQPARTRLRESPLRDLATETGGIYLPLRTGPVEVGQLGKRLEEGLTREAIAGDLPQFIGRKSLFLAAGTALLALPLLPKVGRLRRLTLAGLSAGMVAAIATDGSLERGLALLEAGRYEPSLREFAKAAEGSPDPGLVAYNQGISLARLGRFREAELQFRRSLSEAVGERRAHGLYNLGVTLLRQSEGRDPGLLRQAIQAFSAVRDNEGDWMREPAERNLELAKLLLARIEPPQKSKSPESGDSPANEPQPKSAQKPTIGEISGSKRKADEAAPLTATEGKSTPQATDQKPLPGKGNLPPLPDSETLTPLGSSDVRAILDRELARIAQERRERLRSTPLLRNTAFPDW